MTVVETILVFAAIPLAIVLLMALLIFVPGGRKRVRYKSGQPWDHEPVWYEPHPVDGAAAGHGETRAIGSSLYGEPTGDRHPVRGSSAPGAGAPRAASGGPLGGARGTW